MHNIDITQLREAFTYDPNSGDLVRKSTGRPSKGLDAYGYIQLGYRKKMYKAHRLIWAIVYGEFPKGQIDHINGNRSDNLLCNLRVVTQQQNLYNKQIHKNNSSGFTGVCWNKKCSKWQSSISVKGSNIYLGVFDCPEEAHLAYIKAKFIHHTISA